MFKSANNVSIEYIPCGNEPTCRISLSVLLDCMGLPAFQRVCTYMWDDLMGTSTVILEDIVLNSARGFDELLGYWLDRVYSSASDCRHILK